MKYKQNLHTHTNYCDGINTPREMIEYAGKADFDSIGFSGHSYMSYSIVSTVTPESTGAYIKEINALKEEYKDKIKIFCGIEYDMYSDIDISVFDYTIGALHYFRIGDEYVGFDRGAEEVERIINTYFGGDGMAYAKRYYEEMAHLPEYGDFDIIGHFDLITKHMENRNFFDAESEKYLSWAVSAMESLKGKIDLFEVNTGAIARGYRSTPYPAIPLLKELKRLGFGAVITSDCHDGRFLDCYFDEATELLRECGFREKYILTENGFISTSL